MAYTDSSQSSKMLFKFDQRMHEPVTGVGSHLTTTIYIVAIHEVSFILALQWLIQHLVSLIGSIQCVNDAKHWKRTLQYEIYLLQSKTLCE